MLKNTCRLRQRQLATLSAAKLQLSAFAALQSSGSMNSLDLFFEHLRAFSFSDWLRHVTAEQHLSSLRAVFPNVDSRIWYFLLLCSSLGFLTRIVIEILVPSQPSPAKGEPAQRLLPANAAELRTAPQVGHSAQAALALDATASDVMRDRVRSLELECDALRAEARRSSSLEAQLAAANMCIEELSQKLVPSACSPHSHLNSAAAAAAATPTSSTPFKISHRTPSSAATKSLTVRASLLHRGLATPTGTPSQLR